MKYFWRLYYYFKPVPQQLGKSGYVKYWARVNGIKVKELSVSKTSGIHYMGIVE